MSITSRSSSTTSRTHMSCRASPAGTTRPSGSVSSRRLGVDHPRLDVVQTVVATIAAQLDAAQVKLVARHGWRQRHWRGLESDQTPSGSNAAACSGGRPFACRSRRLLLGRADHAVRLVSRQLLPGMAEPVAEDFVVAGAQRPAGLDRPALRPLEHEGRVRQHDAAERGMVDPLQAAARMHVLVVHDLREIAHRRARHLRREHALRDFVLAERLRPALDQLVDGGEMDDSRRAGDEARILLEVGPAHDVEDRAEMMVARRVEHHVAVASSDRRCTARCRGRRAGCRCAPARRRRVHAACRDSRRASNRWRPAWRLPRRGPCRCVRARKARS